MCLTSLWHCFRKNILCPNGIDSSYCQCPPWTVARVATTVEVELNGQTDESENHIEALTKWIHKWSTSTEGKSQCVGSLSASKYRCSWSYPSHSVDESPCNQLRTAPRAPPSSHMQTFYLRHKRRIIEHRARMPQGRFPLLRRFVTRWGY